MSESTTSPENSLAAPVLHVAPSPHLSTSSRDSRGMMADVLIGLAPVLAMSTLVFHWHALFQIGLCTLSCVVVEAVLCLLMRKPLAVGDYSAAVTGVILGMSLPASAPWFVGVIGSVVAIGLGKVVFGGLGYNLFNPAMVGRAFVMLSFAGLLGASAYIMQEQDTTLNVLTQATPLAAAKQLGQGGTFWPLFIGSVNGSLGETSALALLIGGIFLCVRRTASWEIPVGVLSAGLAWGSLAFWAGLTPMNPLNQLISGAFLLGAFFIATDPVTSPLSGKGKLIFGLGVGMMTILIRVLSGYPEGMMFSILLMNATVPLINRWTIPRPLGLVEG